MNIQITQPKIYDSHNRLALSLSILFTLIIGTAFSTMFSALSNTNSTNSQASEIENNNYFLKNNGIYFMILIPTLFLIKNIVKDRESEITEREKVNREFELKIKEKEANKEFYKSIFEGLSQVFKWIVAGVISLISIYLFFISFSKVIDYVGSGGQIALNFLDGKFKRLSSLIQNSSKSIAKSIRVASNKTVTAANLLGKSVNNVIYSTERVAKYCLKVAENSVCAAHCLALQQVESARSILVTATNGIVANNLLFLAQQKMTATQKMITQLPADDPRSLEMMKAMQADSNNIARIIAGNQQVSLLEMTKNSNFQQSLIKKMLRGNNDDLNSTGAGSSNDPLPGPTIDDVD